MTHNLKGIDRRDFVLGVAASAALLPLGAEVAQAKGTYAELLAARTKGATPAEGKISLEMPDLAENGALVPFTTTVEGDAGSVKAVYVFAPKNPQSEVGQFYFTAGSGTATVTGRMRMGTTQEIVALAEMNDGKLYIAKKNVKVTVGGCGG